jgi:hypothetical protein
VTVENLYQSGKPLVHDIVMCRSDGVFAPLIAETRSPYGAAAVHACALALSNSHTRRTAVVGNQLLITMGFFKNSFGCQRNLLILVFPSVHLKSPFFSRRKNGFHGHKNPEKIGQLCLLQIHEKITDFWCCFPEKYY